MGKEKPNIEVRVKWRRIEGEPLSLWVKLWGKLLAPRQKEQIGTHHDTVMMSRNGRETQESHENSHPMGTRRQSV